MRRADGAGRPGPAVRRGVALLEAIVALALLSVSALGAVVLTRQAALTVQGAQDADAHVRVASAFLGVVSLWPREDLDRHLGSRREGGWVLRIDRPTRTMYRAALYDTAGGAPVLETALFRPLPADAAP